MPVSTGIGMFQASETQLAWSVSRGSTGNGKKPQVLLSGQPCYQDCWHTGLLYASVIGSNPCRLKGQRGLAAS